MEQQTKPKENKLCRDCGHTCISHSDCLKLQDFNQIVENAQSIAKLKRLIIAVPEFKGKTKWFKIFNSNFEEESFENFRPQTRFMTITYDPKKFSYNELTQPDMLIRYFKNALWEIRHLFSKNPAWVIEYHKTGIPHIHMNYEVPGPLELNTLLLRMKYYFAKDLRNRNCIHDRYFNEHGKAYIQKANKNFIQFNKEIWEEIQNDLKR